MLNRVRHNAPMPTAPPTEPTDPRIDDDMTVVKIFESLRDRIVSGAIAPDSLINSVEIAQRFGTSRTPVREALMLLSKYGLITMAARRRPRVAPVSVKGIQDLYALRTALHAYISEAIVRGAPDDALQALRQDAAQLLSDFDDQSTDAHLTSVEAYLSTEVRLSGNAVVQDVLESLQWKISWFRRAGSMSRTQLKVLAFDRVRVADAYLDRDARLAEALNRSMLKKAGAYCELNFVAARAAVEGEPGPA